MHTNERRGNAGREKPSKVSSASAFVSWRARSALKLKKMALSPSRRVATGRPPSAITTGSTNSSVTPRA
jgi:hypothetical protein